MKKNYTYLIVSIIIFIFTSCSTSRNFSEDYMNGSSDITYQQFYNDLSPYGNWVNYQNFGQVWVPYEAGFRPYYNNGHWLYTNYGWTWISGYNWGWAPFHYGRWLYDNAYGWMWVPGYEWAPAWVSWRSGGDCYGWAPLGPGMDFNTNMISGLPYNYWSFVPRRYINSSRLNDYYINREKNVTIIDNTTIINNTNIINNRRVFTGPSTSEVEKATSEKIRPRRIVEKNRPGNAEITGSTISIYKPMVKEKEGQNEEVKLGKIENLNEPKRRANIEPGSDVITKPVRPTDTHMTPPENKRVISNSKIKENPKEITEKKDPVQENQRTLSPQQQRPDQRQEGKNREVNNNTIPQQGTTKQNNDKVPAARIIRQQENIPDNYTPPVKTNPAKEQRNFSTPQPAPPQIYRQETKSPATQTQTFQNQNPAGFQRNDRKENFQRK